MFSGVIPSDGFLLSQTGARAAEAQLLHL